MANSIYHITYKASAAKELRKLDRPTQRRLLAAIEDLAVTPRPDGVKKLKPASHPTPSEEINPCSTLFQEP